MGDLSEHFSRAEFACKGPQNGGCDCNGTFNTVDVELLRILEAIRSHFDRPVIITSGCRCLDWNARCGGILPVNGHGGSQHLYGRAADIVIDGISPEIIAELAIQIGAPGVGRYQTFVHLDSRSHVISRWQG